MRARFEGVMARSALALGLCALAACSTAPKTEGGKLILQNQGDRSVAAATKSDPSLAKVLAEAAGYAVFPSVGKGAVAIGGAYGKGVLYEQGAGGSEFAGYCDLTQASIGFALGGQEYTEIIAFKTKDALNTFKSGNFAFGAQATAVALRSGAGANARYAGGVAVFTMDEAGLMYEASIGGQKFSFQAR